MSIRFVRIECPKCGHAFEMSEVDVFRTRVPIRLPRFTEIEIHDKGRLPHWEVHEGTYFVTFRLADSLPESFMQPLKAKRRKMESQVRVRGLALTPEVKRKISARLNLHVEKALDSCHGACVLRDHSNAEIVAATLHFFDGERCHLYSWCIMPNHVHVVFRLLGEHKLADLIKSWKVFSAKEINKLLSGSGKLWAREYFDRLIRDEEHFERAARYVMDNPARAGLDGWKWVWMRNGSMM